MECKEKTTVVKSEEIIPSDRLEANFEEEIEEELWTVMENIKSEGDTTVDIKPAIYPKTYSVQQSKERLKLYHVRLPLRCRLCTTPDKNMVNIFDPKEAAVHSIAEKIERCLPIVVRKTDTLPKQICQYCLTNLELCYQFHNTVLDAEENLLFFQRTKTEMMNGDSLFSPLCNNSIKTQLKRSSDAETSSNKRRTVPDRFQTADTIVKSNFKLADLKPCSVVLYKNKTLGKNNLGTESVRSSGNDSFDTGRTSVSNTDRQSTCNSRVPGDPQSRMFDLRSEEGSEDQAKPAIHEQDDHKRPRSFHSRKEQIRQKDTHSGKGQHSCLYCDKKFDWLSRREEHHRMHTGERPFKCLDCDKVFTTNNCLRKHIVVHLEEKNYACSLCDKSFKRSYSRVAHMATHLADKPWQCDYCKNYFFRKSLLQNHLRFCRVRYPLNEKFLQLTSKSLSYRTAESLGLVVNLPTLSPVAEFLADSAKGRPTESIRNLDLLSDSRRM